MLHETLCCNPSTVSLWLLRPTWPPYRGLCCVFFFLFLRFLYIHIFYFLSRKMFRRRKRKKKLRKKISSAYTCAGSRNMVNAFDLTWRWIYVSKIIAIFYSWSLEFIACFPFLNLLSNYNCKYVCFCIALLRIILSTTHRFFKCIF